MIEEAIGVNKQPVCLSAWLIGNGLGVGKNFLIAQCDQILKYKAAQKIPKVAQRVTTAVYTWKWMFSKQPKKSTYIWATFVRKFVTTKFPKSPNMVTLHHTQLWTLVCWALGFEMAPRWGQKRLLDPA